MPASALKQNLGKVMMGNMLQSQKKKKLLDDIKNRGIEFEKLQRLNYADEQHLSGKMNFALSGLVNNKMSVKESIALEIKKQIVQT